MGVGRAIIRTLVITMITLSLALKTPATPTRYLVFKLVEWLSKILTMKTIGSGDGSGL